MNDARRLRLQAVPEQEALQGRPQEEETFYMEDSDEDGQMAETYSEFGSDVYDQDEFEANDNCRSIYSYGSSLRSSSWMKCVGSRC